MKFIGFIFPFFNIFNYFCDLRVIAFSTLRDFIKKHAEADKPLRDWYTKVLKAEWKNFADIRKDFNSADLVGNDRYVFNIGGNNFRIVVIVIFLGHKVFIRFIGTHKEYDRIDNITQI